MYEGPKCLLFVAAIFIFSSNAALCDDDNTKCGPSICQSDRTCTEGKSQFTDDYAKQINDQINVKSQIFASPPDRTVTDFCFFRSVTLRDINKNLRFFWEPGGIDYRGEGEAGRSGCVVECTPGSSNLRPPADQKPIDGNFYIDELSPRSVEARAWGPELGWATHIAESRLKPFSPALGSENFASLPNEISFVDKNNVVTRIVAETQTINGDIEYVISNTGQSDVTVSWNLPVYGEILKQQGPFAPDGITLAPGEYYKDHSNTSFGPDLIASYPSQLRVEIKGTAIILSNMWALAPIQANYIRSWDLFPNHK